MTSYFASAAKKVLPERVQENVSLSGNKQHDSASQNSESFCKDAASTADICTAAQASEAVQRLPVHESASFPQTEKHDEGEERKVYTAEASETVQESFSNHDGHGKRAVETVKHPLGRSSRTDDQDVRAGVLSPEEIGKSAPAKVSQFQCPGDQTPGLSTIQTDTNNDRQSIKGASRVAAENPAFYSHDTTQSSRDDQPSEEQTSTALGSSQVESVDTIHTAGALPKLGREVVTDASLNGVTEYVNAGGRGVEFTAG